MRATPLTRKQRSVLLANDCIKYRADEFINHFNYKINIALRKSVNSNITNTP